MTRTLWDKRLLTVLCFSGGKQSTCLLEMVLRGEIKRPDPFLVMGANPGMESRDSLANIERMRERCARASIEFLWPVEGPNLAHDLQKLPTTDATRAELPPLFVKKRNGSRGQLTQRCTGYYKIEPMNRAVRMWLETNLGVSRRTKYVPGHVEKWIGFSHDERHRVKPDRRRYIRLRYPLIELGMTRVDVRARFERWGIPLPARSVCNACWANSPEYYIAMKADRPGDYQQACAVDDSIRELSQLGVREGKTYFSDLLKPIREITEDDCKPRQPSLFGDAEDASCDHGYCFL